MYLGLVLSSYSLPSHNMPLNPTSHHPTPFHICEILVVWHNHLLVVGVLFDVDEVLRIVEYHLDDAVVVCSHCSMHIAKDLPHHLLCFASVVLLLSVNVIAL